MKHSRRTFDRVVAALLAGVGTLVAGGEAKGAGEGHGGGGGHGGGEGHGGGGGHVAAAPGHGGYWHGGYGGYGYPYRYGGCYGPGIGIAIGDPYYGWGYPYYGYPYYGYPAYPYGPSYPYPGPETYPTPVPQFSGPLSASPTPAPAPLIVNSTPIGEPVPTLRGVGRDAPTGTDTDLTLVIRVPAEAVVSINGVKTTQAGERREFLSTGLVPGRNYTFEVRAEWPGAGGKPIEAQTRLVTHAGERRIVNFVNPGAAPRIELAPPAPALPRLGLPGGN